MPQELPTSIRLSRVLRRKLQDAAAAEHRPLSAQIKHILEKWVMWWETQKR